jgi:chromosome partitioning protein
MQPIHGEIKSSAPLVITFLNQKGGVGKSTLCIAIGAVLQRAGYAVAFDDRDPQGSVTFWAREVGHVPLVGDGGEPEVIICDTPGHLSLTTAEEPAPVIDLIRRSQRLVIVSEKSLFSIHATSPMVRLVYAHKSDDARVYLLLNKVRSRRSRQVLRERDLAHRLGVPLMSILVPLSVSFEYLQTRGLSALRAPQLELVLKLALELVQ